MIWPATIIGNPATKKTSNRLVKVKGRQYVIPSAVHDTWFRSALLQARAQWASCAFGGPIAVPCEIAATFHRGDHRRVDLLNLMQALADLLQAAGVLSDDWLIRSWDGSRVTFGAERPRVDLTIGWEG